jgi:tRNA(fMet)-specific endonuclease VapC
MLDTNICSFIMREQPEAVLKRLEQAVLRGQRIVVSAITYSEMRCHRPEGLAAPRSAGRRVLRPPRCHPALGPRRGGRHHGH